MRRITTKVASVLAVVAMVAGIAWAENVHFKNNRNPNFTDNPPPKTLTLSVSGALTGLGNGDVVIRLDASANPTGECCNPGESCKVPGHNPAPVDVTGAQALPGSDIKNGNLSFGPIETDPPTTPIPNAPDCPNHSWAENITDMVFTRATVTVLQPAILACGGDTSKPCASNGDCTGVSCVAVNPDGTQIYSTVFATTCNLSGSNGALVASCP